MVHPQKPGEAFRMRETMEMNPGCLQENGLSQILTLVLEELGLFYHKDVNGIGVLYSLLQAPWLQSLLKVHDCLHQYIRKRPMPVVPKARCLSSEVVNILREIPPSADSRELKRLLQGAHFKALLSVHDTVAQKDFEPILPPLPDNIPENEEAMRIVCLVKNKQALGATIKRHEITGDIIVARVIHGGLADRSGLLYAGDKLVEVNGVPVEGLEPEQVIHILIQSEGTIVFKLIPVGDRTVSSHTMLFVRAMADYWPQQDPAIPCADAGLPFKRGDILQIVDQSDSMWWQARKASDLSRCAGLIPSNHLLKRKQREFWWSQPFMTHSCLKASQLSTIGEEEDMKIDEKCVEADEETFESEELKGDEEFEYVLGPSGVGVNELRKQLILLNPNLFQSPVPHTTRPKKSYEEDGREYFFVSKEMFESLIYSHSFLEYGDYKGHMYGTSIATVKDVLDSGKMCIVDLEPQGITGARTHELKPYVIFIKPPSRNFMRQTRKNATIITDYFVNIKLKEEDFQDIEESAKKMEEQYGQFFDQVLVNDDLHSACVQLMSIVRRAQDEPQWIPASWICSDS
ncbi:MAGUK p55 subfamily member 4 isoform X3 [Hyperolius riggenbachi]|uniref:MAGUK p55 subfamily member 4 isoform X3 n=1 Tax=Hyperolius riggenbachi TaxID=752182 RepID=UPI0035A37A2F